MKDIVIIGAGGFGREVAWLIEDINKEKSKWNLLGFIDDNIKKGEVINGYEVIGGCDFLEKKKDIYYTCAIGASKMRKSIVKKVNKMYNVKAASLVHPSVIIAHNSSVGEGDIICAGNIVTVNVSIGDFNIINLNCTIGHDVISKDFVTLYPSVNVSGGCIINECVEIGTGAKIIQKKMIGKNSIVGAGAVIIKDIKENVTVVGVPGKIISSFQ